MLWTLDVSLADGRGTETVEGGEEEEERAEGEQVGGLELTLVYSRLESRNDYLQGHNSVHTSSSSAQKAVPRK